MSFGRHFFLNQNSKVINNENALYHVSFSVALKSVVRFTNAYVSNYL